MEQYRSQLIHMISEDQTAFKATPYDVASSHRRSISLKSKAFGESIQPEFLMKHLGNSHL